MVPAPMELFLVRHAIAVPRGGDALDHARPLTEKGRSRFQGVVAGLDALGVSLERVYHSPWVRARQTAELMISIAEERVETVRLAQTPDKKLLNDLQGDPVALVGHEPWMGELLSLLTVGDVASGSQFRFKKGGVAHLEGSPSPGGCELVALYPPRALRALGS